MARGQNTGTIGKGAHLGESWTLSAGTPGGRADEIM